MCEVMLFLYSCWRFVSLCSSSFLTSCLETLARCFLERSGSRNIASLTFLLAWNFTLDRNIVLQCFFRPDHLFKNWEARGSKYFSTHEMGAISSSGMLSSLACVSGEGSESRYIKITYVQWNDLILGYWWVLLGLMQNSSNPLALLASWLACYAFSCVVGVSSSCQKSQQRSCKSHQPEWCT